MTLCYAYFFQSSFAKVLREQILKLREGLNTERIARELLAERKEKEVALVESSVLLDLAAEKEV